MKKRGILVVVGFLSLQFTYAQEYSFRVMANKGANEVKSAGAVQPLKTGDRLKKEDELKVSENSYVALVHTSGKPIELRKAGNYKVEELASKLGASSSVLSKYTDFILSSNSAEAKKNRLSATGAVHRGLEDIKLMLPENHNSVYSDTLAINWETKGKGPFTVTLKNMFDEVLYRKDTVLSNNLSVNLKSAKLAKESPILVEVRSKSDSKSKSEQRIVKKLTPAEAEKIKASLNVETKEFAQESSLKEIVKASFFEQNKLIIDAMVAYEKAIKLSPDVPTYKEYYEEFLLRNKLKANK